MSEEKVLGKIKRATFGFIPDSPLFGLELDFSLNGGCTGVGTAGYLSFNAAKHSEYCKWTPAEQRDAAATVTMELIQLLRDAKVNDVSKLAGIPVEVTLDRNCFKSFRILTEVL